MKIKDFKCKCGHNDFFFADKGNQKGIYCSYCGKWLKWADKDEQNLAMKQEPRKGYLSIDDVMSVFEDFMCGEVDEEGTETFLEMLKDKAESENP
jgi:hypothetical protein